MNSMKTINILLKIFLFVGLTFVGKAQQSFIWDHSPDATNSFQYLFYARTNGVNNTNFFKVGTVDYPTNTISVSYNNGTSMTYYVSLFDPSRSLESNPSNLLDFFKPLGAPPANVLLSKTIDSYNNASKIWNNVQISWAAVDFTKYGLTNYTVVLQSSTVTNQFNTVNTNWSFATLARDNYNIFVLTSNSLGTSPLTAGTIWVISSSSPKSPLNLKVIP